MDKIELVKIIFTNLYKRPLRVILTGLGVAIGVALIILMISIGQALRSSIVSQLSGLGTEYISIYPMTQNKAITRDALRQIYFLKHISSVSPLLYLGNARVKVRQRMMNVQIVGIRTEYIKQLNLKLNKGEYFIDSDYPAAIAGFYFSADNGVKSSRIRALHQELLMNPVFLYLKKKVSGPDEGYEKKFKLKVVGIFKPRSGIFDHSIFLSEELIRSMRHWQGYTNEKTYNQAIAKVDSAEFVNISAAAIRKLGFRAYTNKESVAVVNKIYLILQILLGLVGFIALLISTFGIINTMMMSVIERRREIGVLKSIGARMRDIRHIFLGEAAVIGFFGGVLGIALSLIFIKTIVFIAPLLVGKFSGQFSFLTHINVGGSVLAFSMLFSVLLGIAAGTYPAYKISKLKTAEILRNE